MSSNSDFNIIQESLNIVLDALKPLTPEQRSSVLQSAANLFGETEVQSPFAQMSNNSEKPTNLPDLQNFVFTKKTKNDAIAVTVLAYYLKKYRNQLTFKTTDLEALNNEANTGQVFGNISKTVNNAYSRYRFLDKAGEGSKKITLIGEQVVENLADEERVKALIAEHKPRAKRKSSKKEKQQEE